MLTQTSLYFPVLTNKLLIDLKISEAQQMVEFIDAQVR